MTVKETMRGKALRLPVLARLGPGLANCGRKAEALLNVAPVLPPMALPYSGFVLRDRMAATSWPPSHGCSSSSATKPPSVLSCHTGSRRDVKVMTQAGIHVLRVVCPPGSG